MCFCRVACLYHCLLSVRIRELFTKLYNLEVYSCTVEIFCFLHVERYDPTENVFPLRAGNFLSVFQNSLAHSANFRPRTGLFYPFYVPRLWYLQNLLLQIQTKVNECWCWSTWVSASESMLSMRLKGIRSLQRKEDLLLWASWTGEGSGYTRYFCNLRQIWFPLILRKKRCKEIIFA